MPVKKKASKQLMDPLSLFDDICDSPSEIELQFPMYSLWAVDMPGPGPNFVAEAERRSGVTAPKGILKGEQPTKRNGFVEWLEALYRLALYKYAFNIKVLVKSKDILKDAPFTLGHKWGLLEDDPNPNGPQTARIMIVGKHPGWEDLTNGRNFSGPTSQYLIRAFEELGVDEDARAEIYITNVVKFPHLDAQKNTLPIEWIKDCLPILHQEFRLVHPDYILLLGDDAAKAVLGKKAKLSVTNGQVIDFPIARHEFADEPPVYHTAKLMTCMHPARVARQPDLYPQFCGALKQFVDLTNGKQISNVETDLERYEFYDELTLEGWVDLMLTENRTEFAVDCEWQGEWPTDKTSYLRTVQLSWASKAACAIVVRDAKGRPFNGDWQKQLARILKNTDTRNVRLIGHNFRADLPWLYHNGLDLREEFEAPDNWEDTSTKGGFDTMLAVHAWQETHPLGLEVCTSQLVNVPRYDIILEDWKTNFCKEQKIKKSDLHGYGTFPDEVLHSYAMYDADATFRLYEFLNKGPAAKLDVDRNGNSSRRAFWVSMRASPAFLEMEMTGIDVNKDRAEELIGIYSEAKERKLRLLRLALKWPEFNPASTRHRTEMLFGEQYNKKGVSIRPEGAYSLKLKPIKSTGRRPKTWEDIESQERESLKKGNLPGTFISGYTPSTDKETLGILASNPGAKYVGVQILRDLSFISHLLRTTLRPAKTITSILSPVSEDDADGPDFEMIEEMDEAGDKVYEKGLLSYLNNDGRVRTHFFQTKETGRASSSRPNLQAISKRREADYERILGPNYKYALRSIFRATPGNVLIEADYTAAEVAAVSWMSGDKNLIEHARRSGLDESDPDYYDIHSNIAVKAFQLTCEPTKKGLKQIGKIALRTAAKTVFFGYLYGQGAESAARKAKEEGADVSVEEAQALINGLNALYPGLGAFFKSAKGRVKFGWMQNPFGRYRRFSESSDRSVVGESERQACNFPIQSLIADSVSVALSNLHIYRKNNPDVQFKMILQIHDAVILECKPEMVMKIYDEVLPTCMCSGVDIWPASLDGVRLSGIEKPYHLSIGRDIYENWGEDLTKADCKRLAIPERFGKD